MLKLQKYANHSFGLGLPGSSDGRESSCNSGTWVQSLGWEDPLPGNGNPLQYPWLENPMGKGAWWATVHWGHKELDMTEQLTHTPHTHTV